MPKKELLYQGIAKKIEQQIRSGLLQPGDRLPSLREICTGHRVSMNTAQQSYFCLESKGLIEPKPQSGYYVSYTHVNFPSVPSTSSPELMYGKEDLEDIIAIVSANRPKSKLAFSSGIPVLDLLPVAKLNKAMIHAIRYLPDSGTMYDHAGNKGLKRQIAKRSLTWGGKLKEEDIITTAGSMDAISFCMMSLTSRGDTIVVESPIYFGILQLAKSLGLKVIELPTNPLTGVELDALKQALKKKKIKLCLLVSNFNNPIGSCMPNEHKKEVVRLLLHHNIPLIEDDVYGDIYFGNSRPTTCKTYDESGLVLLCNSFSKTLASGYRVGWVAPGKFNEQIAKTKLYHSVSTNTLSHEAISYFLENDRYDAHLRKLRQTLQANLRNYLACIADHFPKGTRVSQPQGGYIMWVELNKRSDALELYDKAILNKISIGPGTMYTLQKQYRNCFRLNFSFAWNERTESAIKLLGKLAHQV